MTKLKVLLVDDHRLVLEGIASMLEHLHYITIIGKASSGEEAINLCEEQTPDVVLMDIVMRGMDGIESTRWIKEYKETIKVILLSSEVNEEYVRRAMKAGVHGYLLKDVPKSVLNEALLEVMEGGKYFAGPVNKIILDTYNKRRLTKGSKKTTTLTRRENEVLKHVAQGKKNQEVAKDLSISVKTVEVHKSKILSKLGLKNSADLILYAIKNKVIEL
ncbi:response regulator transcription factor [Fulvivirga sp. M361]|uniref:response regulator transcription factor n=1 Tax=Fulvivirga sp. M361 TaxID=2594266 RepID=UPI00117B1B20|nr:response regulator transcription factor [Fulvivirga sp. M361]TRX47197.1 response regulator transcription factor [Fulvivirga sp. M361]